MKYGFLFLAFFFLVSTSYAQNAHTYKVTFFNTKSQSNELTDDACREILKTFTFSVEGNKYNFNQNDNPAYSNHKAVAFLTLKNSQFLEIDDVDTKFNYKGKEYKTVSHLSSITYTNPFILKGILINSYCKSAYIVLLDNSDDLTRTTVKSISPTS